MITSKTSSEFRTSKLNVRISVPLDNSDFNSSRMVLFLPQRINLFCCFANKIADAFPIPEVAPVMNIVFNFF
ncbi:hypothetical protein D3C86_1212750 [compost metagenome]